MFNERKIIDGLKKLNESDHVTYDDFEDEIKYESKNHKKSLGVVLECTSCDECFENDRRVTETIECPICAESMIPNYVGDIIPDGIDKIDDNDLIPDDAGEPAITYVGRTDESVAINLHEYKLVKVIRGGKVAKVKVRSRKKRLSPARKRALAKARRKAFTSAAKKARKKSMKIRRRLFGENGQLAEGSTTQDITSAIIEDLKGQFGLEVLSDPITEEEDGIYTITLKVKDDDSTEVDLGEVEDTLSANINADVEVIGPVYLDDNNSEAELTVLVTPFSN